MASQRAKNKVQIGAYIDNATDSGVQTWLDGNPRKTKTDFLFEAIIEKLQRENIPLPPEAGSRQRPMRHTKSKKAAPAETPANLALNETANSAIDAGKNIQDKVLSYFGKPGGAKKLPAKRAHPIARVVPSPATPPGAL